MSTDATEITKTPPEPRPGTTDDKLIPHFNEIGAVPDRIVAAKAGVAINTVRNFRTHYGIPSSKPVTPTKARKAKKGTKAKASAAPKEKGRPGRKSKIKPFHDLVGTMPDQELAKMAGASPSTVENYRRKNKIPAFEAKDGRPAKTVSPKPSKASSKKASAKAPKAPKAAKGRPGRKSKVAPLHDLMGKVPDEEVAAKAGVKVTAVQAYRRKHGIPAFEVEGAPTKAVAPAATKPARTTAAPAAKATSTTRWGWRVTFASEKARLVVASSAGEAVEAAAKAGLDDVVQVERLIEALE